MLMGVPTVFHGGFGSVGQLLVTQDNDLVTRDTMFVAC